MNSCYLNLLCLPPPDDKNKAGTAKTVYPEYCDRDCRSCSHKPELGRAVCTVCPGTRVWLEMVVGEMVGGE